MVWTTSALECFNCSRTLDLTSSETINAITSQCSKVGAQYSSCSQFLRVQHSKHEGSVLFEAAPSESLVLSNAARMMINTTMIWLNKIQFERTFQIFCFHPNACTPNVINDIYLHVRNFEFSTLWGELLTRLYAETVDPAKIECADNEDKSVKCPYGFCRLISSNPASFSRSCVRNQSIPNPFGVVIQSKSLSDTEFESTVTYTCNKPMCNNLKTANEVRRLFDDRGFLVYSATTTTTVTTTVTTAAPKNTATSTKQSTGNCLKL